MLDPASAIGLASSLVQLVNFTKNVLSRSHELYNSTTGALVQNEDLETFAIRLEQLSTDLASQAAKSSDSGDSELLVLCSELAKRSRELSKSLYELRTGTQNRYWSSIRQALSTVWREHEIRGLEERLDRAQKQVELKLLISLQQSVQYIQSEQRVNAEEVKGYFSIIKDNAMLYGDVLAKLHSTYVEKFETVSMSVPKAFTPDLLSVIEHRHDQAQLVQLQEQLIRQLSFEGMEVRHNTIPEAFKKTFSWIFNQQSHRAVLDTTGQGLNDGHKSATVMPNPAYQPRWDNFKDWLVSDQKLYWITGKPGAGKSTLMKFIYNHGQTLLSFRQWAIRQLGSLYAEDVAASHCQAVVIGFFFWNSGTDIQMSKDGLARTLLYQLLKEDKDLATSVLADRWQRYLLFGGDLRPFSWEELIDALQKVLADPRRCFLLVIDGLDEFAGDSKEVAESVIDLSRIPNVKVCTSSRPLTAFEERFEERPTLCIEELTRGDILTYIKTKFAQSRSFRKLENADSELAVAIVQDIAQKAAGVFLWVVLVVQSLLSGLQDGDTVSELRQRLREIPPELEHLFDKIWSGLDPFYRKQASEMVQFLRAVPQRATVLTMLYKDSPLEDALSLHTGDLTSPKSKYYTAIVRRRIHSRCRCLLEIEKPSNRHAKVTWLHRTAREYFMQPSMWNEIEAASPSYDIAKALAVSSLQEAKHMVNANLAKDITETFKDNGTFERLATSSIDLVQIFCNRLLAAALNAIVVADWSIDEKVDFLIDVERVVRDATFGCGEKINKAFSGYWARIAGHVNEMPKGIKGDFSMTTNMASIAIAARLDQYFSRKVQQEKDFVHDKIANQDMLIYAVERRAYRIACILVSHGASLQAIERKKSAWMSLLGMSLKHLEQNLTIEEREAILEALRVFLKHGADPRMMYINSTGRVSTRDVIELACENAERGPHSSAKRALSTEYDAALKRTKERMSILRGFR